MCWNEGVAKAYRGSMPRLYLSIQRHSRRLLIVAWLITWITAVPLFHVHVPDTTDRWSSLQSGGPHTVFTADLPGEFSHPFPDHFGHLSQRTINSPELGFALSNNKSNDKNANALHVVNECSRIPNALLIGWLFESCDTLRGPPPSYAPDVRAPPRIVCL
jgi:hypothetical protein